MPYKIQKFPEQAAKMWAFRRHVKPIFRTFSVTKSLTFFLTAEFMPLPGPGQQEFDNQYIGDGAHFPPSPLIEISNRIKG